MYRSMLRACKILSVIYYHVYLKLCFIDGSLSFVCFMSLVHLFMLASILFPSLVKHLRILKRSDEYRWHITDVLVCLVWYLQFVLCCYWPKQQQRDLRGLLAVTEKACSQSLRLIVFQEVWSNMNNSLQTRAEFRKLMGRSWDKIPHRLHQM